jgi:hypothetical protein
MEGGTPPEPATEAPRPSAPAAQSLYDNWTLWAHLPHDTDWSVKSYKKIMTFGTVGQTVALLAAVPEEMVRNCMLFLMRKGVHPTWEDKRNRGGGCFSYKVSNKSVGAVWRQLSYALVGEGLSAVPEVRSSINGVTISPKKNFCILKVWMASCHHQDPAAIAEVPGVSKAGCIFKRHVATS